VKWKILDSSGNPVSDPASFTSLTSIDVPCGTLVGAVDAVETYATATGSAGLQYLGAGSWQYNWKTLTAYVGTCRQLKLTLADGITHIANFKFTR
jgi:hypothetical protein